jgi:hypothetical protein
MFRNASLTVLAAMFISSTVALAKPPASAPAGTTGMCKDGSFTSATSKSGACSGHDGVKKWYGVPAEASSAAADTSSTDKGTSSSRSKKKSDAAAASAAVPDAMSSDTGTASAKNKKKSDSATSGAAAPAAPMGAATGTCKDGTSTSATSKSGACSGHGGVKEWHPAGGAMSAAPMTKAMPATSAAAGGAAATGTCKDGTSTSAASKSGACSGHGGVKEWNATSGAMAPAAAAPMGKSMPATKPAPASAMGGNASSSTPAATPAPGGGPGQVWVNKLSKVYHCPSDQWYGKTKEGGYMTEADALAQGYRADHGKACH